MLYVSIKNFTNVNLFTSIVQGIITPLITRDKRIK